VIDCSDLPAPADGQYGSDDEDQQSTSNFSDAGVHTVVDDSSCALQAHAQDCFSIAVVAERWLASGGEDDVAFLWDQQVSDSDPVTKIEHDDSVTHVAFNNSQTLLATADMSGKIIITQLSDLSTRAKLSDCNDMEWTCWHNTSDILFAGDKDGIVYSGNGSSCTYGQLLPDGKRLLAGYADGAVSQLQLFL
ncbi:WD domain, G-beta repeat protein, partial [Cooperia oncophora]